MTEADLEDLEVGDGDRDRDGDCERSSTKGSRFRDLIGWAMMGLAMRDLESWGVAALEALSKATSFTSRGEKTSSESLGSIAGEDDDGLADPNWKIAYQ